MAEHEELVPSLATPLLGDPKGTEYFTDFFSLTKVIQLTRFLPFLFSLCHSLSKAGGAEITCLCIRILWSEGNVKNLDVSNRALLVFAQEQKVLARELKEDHGQRCSLGHEALPLGSR